MSLGLDRTVDRTLLEALALPPVPLPDDWQDRRDFLRVHNLRPERLRLASAHVR